MPRFMLFEGGSVLLWCILNEHMDLQEFPTDKHPQLLSEFNDGDQAFW